MCEPCKLPRAAQESWMSGGHVPELVERQCSAEPQRQISAEPQRQSSAELDSGRRARKKGAPKSILQARRPHLARAPAGKASIAEL